MELTDLQRQKIGANCLTASWQQLAPWLMQATGNAHAAPDDLVGWLLSTADRAPGPVQAALRDMENRIWRVEAPHASEHPSNGLWPLKLVCGGVTWSLHMQRTPEPRVVRIAQ